MLARCSRSLVNRSLPRPFTLVTACGVVCFPAAVISLAARISPLLLLQQYMSGDDVADGKGGKNERIQPEIGKAKPLGKGADADRLEPGPWKRQAHRSCLAGECRHGHQQAGKVRSGNDRDNGGGKNGAHLCPREGREEQAEGARR